MREQGRTGRTLGGRRVCAGAEERKRWKRCGWRQQGAVLLERKRHEKKIRKTRGLCTLALMTISPLTKL